MLWVTPTLSDLQAVLGADKIAKYAGASIVDGEPDVVTDSISKISAEVRSYCLPFTSDFGPAGTIPSECMRHAMVLTACMIMARMSIEIPKSNDTDRKAAIEYFQKVSEGKIRVTGNGSNATAVTGATHPSFSPRFRSFGRQYESGI